MSEIQAKSVIQDFLSNNEPDILAGIIHYEQQRHFVHITRSLLTPPTGYYFVAIECSRKRVKKVLVESNDIFDPITTTEYEITIHIVDYITGTLGEGELYEGMNDDFNLMTDRIMDLLPEQDYFQNDLSRFRLSQDTEISCGNTPIYWDEAETAYATLLAEISFTIETC